MKQRVNFYQAEFRKPEVKFPARQMLYVALGVLLLVGIVGSYQHWLERSLSRSIEQVASKNIILENKINDRKKALELVQTDPKLEKKLAQLKSKNSDKRRLTSYINKIGLGGQSSVTEFYKALSQNDISGLWLNKITLYQHASDISLNGLTRDASDVPMYIEKMKKIPAFNGVSFHAIKLNQSKEFPLYTEFYLDSRKHADEG